MKTGRRRGAGRPMAWLATAAVCVLAGHAPAQGSGAAERQVLETLSNNQLRGAIPSSFRNSGTSSSLFVPVILTASGQNNSFFTSELTLTNRGDSEARLEYTYTAHRGGGSGKATEVLAPGQQKIQADALEHLRELGIPIPYPGNQIGTLRVEVTGSHNVGVSVRTTTSVPEGRAGLAYPGIATADGFQEAVYLCGLRQNSQDRSNVAFQNMGTSGQGNVTLKTTVYSGDAENRSPHVLPDVMLPPGGFHQYNGILNRAGFDNGYVKVERVEGTASFYAYGVINDQANSDGSFVFPVTASSLTGTTGQTLPVIVETGPFTSELTVTNFSASDKTLNFSFVADAIANNDDTATFSLMLQASEQRILPQVIDWLRQRQVAGIGATNRTFVGALFATAAKGDMSGIVIGARTGAPDKRGGQYSLFYNGVPYGLASVESAWIYGLQQNSENRSNLALVNTGEVDDSPSVFQLDIYDGETGTLANTVTGLRIAARGWRQINGILGSYAPGTFQGYVRIRKISGNNPFLAYGVINDGGAPGQRSGDGAYLPASRARERIHDPGTAPMTDREVLETLYNSTDGPNWRNAQNWLTDAPLGDWYGVDTDPSGGVVRLDVGHRYDFEKERWVTNGLTGPIPAELGNLDNLEVLRLAGNALTGPIPPELGHLTALTRLDLSENALFRPIPPELGNLPELAELNLAGNQLTGEVPPELGNLPELAELNLAGNQLTGEIPPELGNLPELAELNLAGNQLTGGIPPELGNLPELAELNLVGNQLTGSIPLELGELSALSVLSLGNNELVGRLPPQLGNLINLVELWLSVNPGLRGPLPKTMLRLAKLRHFHYDVTDLCAPRDTEFQGWFQALENARGRTCNSGEFSHRSVLEAFYEATGGESWNEDTNWGTLRPLDDWYGVAADTADLVTELDLSDNGLRGSLHPNVGDLETLERLLLRDNPGLVGAVPGTWTSLASLAVLDIDDTGLCMPPSVRFRQWLSGVRDFGGSFCEDDHGNDRENATIVTSNRTVSGALNYADDEDYYRVEVEERGTLAVRLGGVDHAELRLYDEQDVRLAKAYCCGLTQRVAPGVYFVRVSHRLVAPVANAVVAYSLQLSLEPAAPGTRAYLTQAVQSHDWAVPLVAGEDALLRVFVMAGEDVNVTMPPVRATFYQDGSAAHVAKIAASAAAVPSGRREDSLEATANALIPGEFVTPGLEMVVTIDPDDTLDSGLAVGGRIPETGRLTVDVRTVPDFKVTVVPILRAENPDSALVSAVAELEPSHEAFYETREWLPVAGFEVAVREPLVVSGAGFFLAELEMLRVSDGAAGHYLGFLQSSVAGVAILSGRSAIVGGDHLTTQYGRNVAGAVVAHEFGHNFSLLHAPCGIPAAVDPHYRHRGGRIGAWGYDFRSTQLVDPSRHRDLMSYCGPQWISDYSFTQAADYRIESEASRLTASRDPGAPGRVLLVRGGRLGGRLRLDPSFVLHAPPVLPDAAGPYRLSGTDAAGRVLFAYRFAMAAIADAEGEDAAMFTFAVPAPEAWARALDRIVLAGPEGTVELGREGAPPERLVLDASSGRILGILRGEDGLAHSAAADGQARATVTLLSRGIPVAAEWRR